MPGGAGRGGAVRWVTSFRNDVHYITTYYVQFTEALTLLRKVETPRVEASDTKGGLVVIQLA